MLKAQGNWLASFYSPAQDEGKRAGRIGLGNTRRHAVARSYLDIGKGQFLAGVGILAHYGAFEHQGLSSFVETSIPGCRSQEQDDPQVPHRYFRRSRHSLLISYDHSVARTLRRAVAAQILTSAGMKSDRIAGPAPFTLRLPGPVSPRQIV